MQIKLYYKANRKKNADMIRICVHCIWNQNVASTTNSHSALLLFRLVGELIQHSSSIRKNKD